MEVIDTDYDYFPYALYIPFQEQVTFRLESEFTEAIYDISKPLIEATNNGIKYFIENERKAARAVKLYDVFYNNKPVSLIRPELFENFDEIEYCFEWCFENLNEAWFLGECWLFDSKGRVESAFFFESRQDIAEFGLKWC